VLVALELARSGVSSSGKAYIVWYIAVPGGATTWLKMG
jgi:hypothetical protein